jgi:hypothetical protein
MPSPALANPLGNRGAGRTRFPSVNALSEFSHTQGHRRSNTYPNDTATLRLLTPHLPRRPGPMHTQCRFCCKSLSWASKAYMLRLHLKGYFLRQRLEECESSKDAGRNQDSIRSSTPNLEQGAERPLQQNLAGSRHMQCSKLQLIRSPRRQWPARPAGR